MPYAKLIAHNGRSAMESPATGSTSPASYNKITTVLGRLTFKICSIVYGT
ncbi:hypothetical protein ABIC78_004049 [Novosphingobium sp. 1529]